MSESAQITEMDEMPERWTRAKTRDALIDSALAGGWSVVELPPSNGNSSRFALRRENLQFVLRLYAAATVHHLGGDWEQEKWRIQLSLSADDQLIHLEPDGLTALVGWWPDGECFVAWDCLKHQGPVGKNSAKHVNFSMLEAGRDHGIALDYHAGNDETVVIFRRSGAAEYFASMGELHSNASSVPQQIVAPVEALTITSDAPREVIESVVRRRIRSWTFRRRVLEAYEHACSFCGLQLGLVDAAHIVPVTDARSTDLVPNGIALCALHHRAFDTGLIAMRANLDIAIDNASAERLMAAGLSNGLEGFRTGLRAKARVPADSALQPSISNIEIGHQLRGWIP